MGLESIAESVYATVIGLSGFQAYTVILLVLFACGMGLPVPEDITLFAAGFLAFQGRISLTGAFLVGMVGVLVGDSFMYWIGRIFGRRVVGWPIFRKVVSPSRMARAEGKIQRNARKICFTARFAPGLRAPIYLTSGVLGVPFSTFFLMDALAAVISVPLWVSLAYLLGDQIERLFQIADTAKTGIIIALFSLVAGFIVYRMRRKFLKKHLIQN